MLLTAVFGRAQNNSKQEGGGKSLMPRNVQSEAAPFFAELLTFHAYMSLSVFTWHSCCLVMISGHGRPDHYNAQRVKDPPGKYGLFQILGTHHRPDRHVLLHGTHDRRGENWGNRMK